MLIPTLYLSFLGGFPRSYLFLFFLLEKTLLVLEGRPF